MRDTLQTQSLIFIRWGTCKSSESKKSWEPKEKQAPASLQDVSGTFKTSEHMGSHTWVGTHKKIPERYDETEFADLE